MMHSLVHRLAIAASAGLLLAAFATLPPKNVPHVYVDNLDVTAMRSVFRKGLDEIKARAYDDQNIDDLFKSAVANFPSLDAAVTVTFANDHVTFARGDLTSDVTIAFGDPTTLTTGFIDAVLAARKISTPLKIADEEAFYKAAFAPMLAKVDLYSRYATRQDAARNRLIRDGVIGLGLQVVSVPAGALVNAIVVGGPADRAGIKSNDVIVKVDGTRIARRSLTEMRGLLDGSNDTVVNLEIRRLQEPKPIFIEARRDLIVPDTATYTLNDGIAELHVRGFNQRTGRAVSRAITEARVANGGSLKGIILDLRTDPGGLLDQAVEMADLFLDSGVIAVLKGRHPGAQQFYAAHRGDISDGAPIVIIVDGRTASAAEIVAAALQDNGRALVVGTESLGKGSVQTVVRLPNGGELSVTWAHVTTARGTLLHGLGILPDLCLAGDGISIQGISQETIAGLLLPAETRHQWVVAGPDEAVRKDLRTACPAQANPERAAETDLAHLLLSDRALMAQVTVGGSPQLAVKP